MSPDEVQHVIGILLLFIAGELVTLGIFIVVALIVNRRARRP